MDEYTNEPTEYTDYYGNTWTSNDIRPIIVKEEEPEPNIF